MRKQAYIAKERVIPSAKADKYEADGTATKLGVLPITRFFFL